MAKPARPAARNTGNHPIIQSIFLAQLGFFAVLGLGSLTVYSCLDATCSQPQPPDPLWFLIGLTVGICNLGAILAWFLQHRAVSLKLSKISLAILCLVVTTGLAALFITLLKPGGFSETFGGISLRELLPASWELLIPIAPFALLWFVRRYRDSLLAGAKQQQVTMNVRLVFALQLLLAIFIQPGPLTSWLSDSGGSVLLLAPVSFWPLVVLLEVVSAISWLAGRRPLSVALAQLGLLVIAILNIWDILLISTIANVFVTINPAAAIPAQLLMFGLARIILPIAVLLFIRKYRSQLVDA